MYCTTATESVPNRRSEQPTRRGFSLSAFYLRYVLIIFSVKISALGQEGQPFNSFSFENESSNNIEISGNRSNQFMSLSAC